MWQARNRFAILFYEGGRLRSPQFCNIIRARCILPHYTGVENLTINESLNYSTDKKQVALIGMALNVISGYSLMNVGAVWLWCWVLRLKEAKWMTSVQLYGKPALWCSGMNEDVKLHQIDWLHGHHVVIRCWGLLSIMSVEQRGFIWGHGGHDTNRSTLVIVPTCYGTLWQNAGVTKKHLHVKGPVDPKINIVDIFCVARDSTHTTLEFWVK